MMAKFSLVVPTYNEAANIAHLCSELVSLLKSQPVEFEIIVVDDNSSDGTWKIVENLAHLEKRIRLMRRQERGLAMAIALGWAQAEGDILGVMDADLQHPPQVLLKMLDIIMNNEEADIVVASRYIKAECVPEYNFWRRRLSRAAIVLSRVLLPGSLAMIKDPTSGYFILRRKVISGKELAPVGYKMLLEVIVKGAYNKIFEVPYVFKKREHGASKINLKQYLIFLLHLIKLRINLTRRWYNSRKGRIAAS